MGCHDFNDMTQLKQWEEEGFLVVEGAYAGEDLQRLQAAFDRYAAEAKPQWLDEVEAGTKPAAYFDIPEPLQKDEAFIDLADHPGYFGLLREFLGEDLLFEGAQVRTLPLSPVSYVGWHPDIPHGEPQHIKVQIYVEEVLADGGAFAFVPGSHKADSGPYPVYDELEQMPGHKLLPGAAGTAILFNNHGWHTSMINKTRAPRKSIILSYVEQSGGKKNPERHEGIVEKLTTPQRRMLFGLES